MAGLSNCWREASFVTDASVPRHFINNLAVDESVVPSSAHQISIQRYLEQYDTSPGCVREHHIIELIHKN